MLEKGSGQSKNQREINSPRKALDFFLNPAGIAVIGSFKEGWFGGSIVIRDLVNGSYSGEVFPVNPNYQRVHGVKVYQSINDIETVPDLAVIIRARQAVPYVIEECGLKGIPAAVVVSDAFAERDETGINLQKEIVERARRYGMRLMGPNTVGVINAGNGVTTVPYEKGYPSIPQGHLSIISQTGLAGPQALELSDLNIGVSKIIDLGNMCDVDETECLEYLGNDPDTHVISMYIENIRHGLSFLNTARRVTRQKPVLCLKSGQSQEGAEAIISHTGSMAGFDSIYEGVFRQCGVIRIDDFREILTLSKVFLSQPLPKGNRMGVVSITGAGGVMAMDFAEKFNLKKAELADASIRKLESIFPSLGKNPVDVGPAAALSGDFYSLYSEAIRVFLEDEGVDCLFCALYSTPVATPSFYGNLFDELSEHLTKPITAWAYGTSQSQLLELRDAVEQRGIPVFYEIQPAIRALGKMACYAEWVKR
jgi:acyl-CoA synthetase (NDP forming)